MLAFETWVIARVLDVSPPKIFWISWELRTIIISEYGSPEWTTYSIESKSQVHATSSTSKTVRSIATS